VAAPSPASRSTNGTVGDYSWNGANGTDLVERSLGEARRRHHDRSGPARSASTTASRWRALVYGRDWSADNNWGSDPGNYWGSDPGFSWKASCSSNALNKSFIAFCPRHVVFRQTQADLFDPRRHAPAVQRPCPATAQVKKALDFIKQDEAKTLAETEGAHPRFPRRPFKEGGARGGVFRSGSRH